MGLSRNKVAVSEGAAGSPPFYGEPSIPEGSTETEVERQAEENGFTDRKTQKLRRGFEYPPVVQFLGTVRKRE